MNRSVLVVTNMYPDAQNPNFGTFVQEQVEGLRLRGLDMDVLVVGGKRQRLSYVGGAQRFLHHISQRRYDLIHAHYVFSGLIARLQYRCPVLLTHHGIEVLRGWTAPLCWVISRCVEGVIVMSDEMKQALGLPNAYVIPCGVNLDLFKPLPQAEARAELGLPLDKRLVLFAGFVRPEKRLDIIRAAVELLRAEERKRPPLKGDLQGLQGEPCTELIIATGQPHERIPWYLNACDVLALASEKEGSPVIIKEAMACNLPIVAVDVGDVAQVIGKTEGCYICQRDPKDMAQRLKWALDRGQRTDGRRAVQYLGLESTVDKILRVYEAIW